MQSAAVAAAIIPLRTRLTSQVTVRCARNALRRQMSSWRSSLTQTTFDNAPRFGTLLDGLTSLRDSAIRFPGLYALAGTRICGPGCP